MSASVLFVSVNKSFKSSFTISQLEPWVERAWAVSLAKVEECDRVVAVLEGQPVAAWPIRGAFLAQETYNSSGGPRPRVGMSLGDPIPILAAYNEAPALRRGAATAVLNVEPLPPTR